MDNVTSIKKEVKRDSNLELFRIITMIFIVAHHYVVNSGLMDIGGPIQSNPLCFRSLFLLLFGAWGKTGINCFVFITGYFMCKSNITKKKFLKLIFEIYFYKVLIYLIFLLSGYEKFGLKNFIKLILPFSSISNNFIGCYLLFFLCIPFLNLLINGMVEKQHRYLILLLVFIYVISGSIPMISISFNYVTWFCVLYIISSYVRLYPLVIFENTKLWLLLTIISVLIASMSIIGLCYIENVIGKFNPYFFVADSNKIFAVTTGFSSFMLFKNLKIKYNPLINAMGASTFGVLLIHANSSTMRKWLWVD